ncbi:MAG: hypothetical protein CYPHOPRED_002244 [Cyphobasidiales sp. Tagirdzhanova-0007]|nr:MAG: hypothetical protein CYPHOPRED_002244 [Cyphobasidiales sp. Tagirdzhanova-0007]
MAARLGSVAASSLASQSSATLVTPAVLALSESGIPQFDAHLFDFLNIESPSPLQMLQIVMQSAAHAQAKQDVRRALIEREIEQDLGVPPQSVAGASDDTPLLPADSHRQVDEALRSRLETIGFRVGWALAERLAKERAPIARQAAQQQSTAAVPTSAHANTSPPLEPLEVVKFVCKDVWTTLYDKQIDNLRTNHRGVFVLQDNAFKPLLRLSVPNAHDVAMRDAGIRKGRQMLGTPAGIIKGALAALGLHASISVEYSGGKYNSRLREDLDRPRIRISEAAQSLIRFCSQTRDLLVPSLWGAVEKTADPLKHLEDYISLSIVHWYKGDKDEKTGKYPGWHFATPEEEEGCIPDPLFGAKLLSEIYFKADKDYEGLYSVPVLWDIKKNTIVSNDSAQIMRMLSTCFDEILPNDHPGKGRTYFPSAYAEDIEKLTPNIQSDLNTGVYKAGFAPDQETYDGAVEKVFETLDMLEQRIVSTTGPFLLGEDLTELDVRVFTTLIRFDPVYASHFKCNLTLIRHGYPALYLWLRRLYWQVPAIRDSVNERHIKLNYYKSHKDINPTAIVPKGPRPFIEDLRPDEEVNGLEKTTRGVPE